ncbi:AAA family ATPase [Methylobacterium sp. A54F]
MTFIDQDLPLEPREDHGGNTLKDELRAGLKLLRRRRSIILIGAVLGALICGLYAILATPTYRAVAQISIDSRQLAVLELKDERRKQEPVFDSARVDSQVEAIRSERTVRAVATALKLADDPAFNGTRPSAIQPLKDLFSDPDPPPNATERLEAAIDVVAGALSVVRTDNTFVIEIRFTWEDPATAARVANGFAQAFIQEQLDANKDITGKAAGWLRGRLGELAGEASRADAAVADFKRKNTIATADGKSIDDQALSSIQTALTDAATATATAAAKVEQIAAINAAGTPDGTISDSLTNEVVIRLRQQYLENRQRAADLASRVSDDHPAVQRLRAENRTISDSIRAEMGRIEQSYRSDYEIAKKREDTLRQNMSEQFKRASTIGQLSVELLQLESVSRTARAAYETAAERYLQAVQNQSLPVTDVRIVASATPPTRKYAPKRMLIVAIGTAVGTLLGLIVGAAIDFGDRSIRTRAEAAEVLRCSCLGFIPAIGDNPARLRPMLRRSQQERSPAGQKSPLDHVLQEPFSIGAETIRAMRIAADQAWQGRGARCIGMVSCFPGEGKTTVSANLALMLAQSGARVLLIDCDLRNPAMSRNFAPHAECGLPDVLLGRASIAATLVRPIPALTFDFLPGISRASTLDIADLAGSRALSALLQAVRVAYTYVIVDLPPLMPVVDVRALAESMDGFFLVIHWNDTSRDAILDALNSAPVVWDRLIGSVLNKARLPELARYGEDVRSYFDRRYMQA